MSLPLAIWTTGRPVREAEERRGNFFRMIREGLSGGFSGEFLDIQCIESAVYPDPKSVAGIVVSGSPDRLGEQEKWMLETESALRLAHEAGTPILGICFGHQLLGEALGGTVSENPRGREIGTSHMRFHKKEAFLEGMTSPPIVVMSHLDSVLEKPPNTLVLASTVQEPHAVLKFSATSWGVQFHPEMDTEIIGYYLSARRKDIEAEGLDVDELLRTRERSGYGAELLSRFGLFCATGTFVSTKP